MRILTMSDVHRGSTNKPWRQVHPEADAIVVAGDIEHPEFLRQMSRRHPNAQVLAVLGNHDFYHRRFGKTTVDWWRNEVADHQNISILEKDEKIIGDVVFLGTTMWVSPPPQDHKHLLDVMNDFHVINGANGRLTMEEVCDEFAINIAWLEAKLNEHKGKKVVVITHFCPADFTIPEKYKGDDANSYYSAGLDNRFMTWAMPGLWLFGHTHEQMDVVGPITRFVCNPYGYYFERINKAFDPNLIIEV